MLDSGSEPTHMPHDPVSEDEVLRRFSEVRIDRDNIPHYVGLLQRRLLINRCMRCRTWHAPPRSICHNCWSRDVLAEEVSGEGVVALVTFLHQGPAMRGVTYRTPYPLVTVELAEQPALRVTSTVVGCPLSMVKIGLAVTLTWIERGGRPSPAFQPRKLTSAP
jgi:uncharacterized OB-fold protein